MKISKNYEQAIYVLLLLATQKDHKSLKSNVMSQILEVSDSSLKKTLRKLVVKGLISSNASKDGGFKLKQSIKETTLLDVLIAIEGDKIIDYSKSHLARKIFPNKTHTIKSEELVFNTIDKGESAFKNELNNICISDLLELETIENGAVDWNSSFMLKKM
ncbi:Rrf2 family transcriptional regulator [Lactiplantibacillus plantarum EGD-AQ4]|nr:Rrf2 family transcriptional regulator [Lactiplantibacillus plantarum EGD-AQ4]